MLTRPPLVLHGSCCASIDFTFDWLAGNSRHDPRGAHGSDHPNRLRPPGTPLRQDPDALAGGECLRGASGSGVSAT